MIFSISVQCILHKHNRFFFVFVIKSLAKKEVTGLWYVNVVHLGGWLTETVLCDEFGRTTICDESFFYLDAPPE